jgi:hypothetical protein
MALDESAKALIVKRIQHSSKAVKELEAAYRAEVIADQLRKQKRKEMIRDMVHSDRHIFNGDPSVIVGDVGFLKKKAN